MHTKSKPSWRAILPVHPAADMFPMLSEPELRAVGKHIKKNGLQSPIVIGLKLGANYASSCASGYCSNFGMAAIGSLPWSWWLGWKYR